MGIWQPLFNNSVNNIRLLNDNDSSIWLPKQSFISAYLLNTAHWDGGKSIVISIKICQVCFHILVWMFYCCACVWWLVWSSCQHFHNYNYILARLFAGIPRHSTTCRVYIFKSVSNTAPFCHSGRCSAPRSSHHFWNARQSVSSLVSLKISAWPSAVGRGILTRPPECLRRSPRAFLTSCRLQSPCHTGSSRPCMQRMTLDVSAGLRRPRSRATYTIRDMSMFTASPCNSAGRTFCSMTWEQECWAAHSLKGAICRTVAKTDTVIKSIIL